MATKPFMSVACGVRDEAYNTLVARVKTGLTGECTMQPIPEPCFDPALMEAVSSEWPAPDDPRWFRTTNPAVKNLAQVCVCVYVYVCMYVCIYSLVNPPRCLTSPSPP